MGEKHIGYKMTTVCMKVIKVHRLAGGLQSRVFIYSGFCEGGVHIWTRVQYYREHAL